LAGDRQRVVGLLVEIRLWRRRGEDQALLVEGDPEVVRGEQLGERIALVPRERRRARGRAERVPDRLAGGAYGLVVGPRRDPRAEDDAAAGCGHARHLRRDAGSTPATLAPRAAASSAALPVPQPTSTTCSPAAGAAPSTTARAAGSSRAAVSS
jgi:hypothetical protein